MPCHIVSAIEGVPAVVGSHSSQCDDTVTHGKDTEQRQLLSDRYLEIPVEECRKNGSQGVLGAGYDAGSEDVGTFVEAVELVTL